jgi:hypothetical protein
LGFAQNWGYFLAELNDKNTSLTTKNAIKASCNKGFAKRRLQLSIQSQFVFGKFSFNSEVRANLIRLFAKPRTLQDTFYELPKLTQPRIDEIRQL